MVLPGPDLPGTSPSLVLFSGLTEAEDVREYQFLTRSEIQESIQDKELDQRKAITRKRSLGGTAD